MPHCRSCGGFVSPRFGRVFGNNRDEVYGCRECLSVSELLDDGVATPDDGDGT